MCVHARVWVWVHFVGAVGACVGGVGAHACVRVGWACMHAYEWGGCVCRWSECACKGKVCARVGSGMGAHVCGVRVRVCM
jgi:hypothetical protein